MNDKMLDYLKKRIAITSVGPSTMRGMGPKGTIEAVREYLKKMDIMSFKVRSKSKFIKILDVQTSKMIKTLPTEARYWGSARKALNIFLRGINYNRFLCSKYKLYHLEPWLEIPLDSHVAKGLKIEPEGHDLPRWKTVISLTPDISNEYQTVAQEVARRLNIHRVHLDLVYWRGDHIGNKALRQSKR